MRWLVTGSAPALTMAKLGMTFEGTLRRAHHRYDGFHDMELLALLASDAAAADPPGAKNVKPTSG